MKNKRSAIRTRARNWAKSFFPQLDNLPRRIRKARENYLVYSMGVYTPPNKLPIGSNNSNA